MFVMILATFLVYLLLVLVLILATFLVNYLLLELILATTYLVNYLLFGMILTRALLDSFDSVTTNEFPGIQNTGRFSLQQDVFTVTLFCRLST